MNGQLSASAHTATNFARVGGRIAVARGRTNRAHFTLYPDAPPFCFRVGTSHDCNWQIYAEGVAPRHVDLLWDGFALWAEPLHGSMPIRLNEATHRHRVRIVGNTRLSVGDAFIDITLGTEAAQREVPAARDRDFHVARPPQPVDRERAHLRTAVGVPVDTARIAQYELDAIKLAALTLAKSSRRDARGKRLTHTQPIFAVEALLSEAEESVSSAQCAPSLVPTAEARDARIEATRVAASLEDVPYAHSEPPRASGIRPRVFSDAPPPSVAPYAATRTHVLVAPVRPELAKTQRDSVPASAPVRPQARPRPPLRTVPPARAFSAPVPAPEAARAPEALFRREVELRDRYIRELARQRAANVASPTSIFDPVSVPMPRPARARAQPPKASGLFLVIVMAIALGLSPLTQPEVREGLRARSAAVLQHPALRDGSARVTRLLRSLVVPEVPALPRADNGPR